MGCLSCGDINKHIIYVIIGGLGKIFAELIYKVDNEIHLHPFYLGIASGLGMCLSIIPYIFLRMKTKSLRKSQKALLLPIINNDNAINGSNRASFQIDGETKISKKMICQKYLLILLTGFLDFLQKILSYIFIENIIYNFWIFDMVFLSLFSYIILKNKLYKHQFLSLGIMVLLGLALNILAQLDAKKHKEDEEINTEKGMNFKNIFLVFSIEVIYSFSMVINNYLIDYRFSTPYEISCYAGCLITFLNVILLAIFTNIEMTNEKYQKIKYNEKFYLDNFYQYTSRISPLEIIVFIVVMITRLLFNLFSNITVKYYTPPHIALILLIGEITFIFDHERDLFFYIKVVITMLITFFLLVFLEIIELNFCGLQKFTRKNIAERADKASGQSDDSNDVDGLEIHSNGSSDGENSKDTDSQSMRNLEPDKEIEFKTITP